MFSSVDPYRPLTSARARVIKSEYRSHVTCRPRDIINTHVTLNGCADFTENCNRVLRSYICKCNAIISKWYRPFIMSIRIRMILFHNEIKSSSMCMTVYMWNNIMIYINLFLRTSANVKVYSRYWSSFVDYDTIFSYLYFYSVCLRIILIIFAHYFLLNNS